MRKMQKSLRLLELMAKILLNSLKIVYLNIKLYGLKLYNIVEREVVCILRTLNR